MSDDEHAIDIENDDDTSQHYYNGVGDEANLDSVSVVTSVRAVWRWRERINSRGNPRFSSDLYELMSLELIAL